METQINFLSEATDENILFETEQSDIYLNTFSAPGPKDDEGEDEEDTGDTEDTSNDDPPLDEEVVHSPVTTQPGGKPNS